MALTPAEFARQWSGSTRTEKAAAQEHFIDLCRMLGVPTPNEADPTGADYAFEKGVATTGGGDGFADVWRRGYFAWEYKGKKKNLDDAYMQLLRYRDALDNPPTLVVCDLDRFVVRTNFTNTPTVVHEFSLKDLLECPKEPLRILRAVMEHPEELKPGKTREELTEEAAKQFASLAELLRTRDHEPHAVAHFLNKLVFCMFAEDSGLLPRGLVQRLASVAKGNPATFTGGLSDLFSKMSHEGGLFGADRIQWFNGGLFDGGEVLPLTAGEIAIVERVSRLNWSQVEPAIFGTLFERGLDPSKRSQLGAHYTDKIAILRLIEPVLLEPLRRDLEATMEQVEALVAEGKKITVRTPASKNPQAVFQGFLDRLRAVRVLDPACGSGNFLYLALQALKDLEREAIQRFSLTTKTSMQLPEVGPQAVLGIELNSYAAELARVVIWIGEIQWMLGNGHAYLRDPILRPLDNIECRDAVVDLSDPDDLREPAWPEATVIVGNPPFLGGGERMRAGLGDAYVDALVFARDDDYSFGVLHSAVHELWTRRLGGQVREVESGFRYTPTTTFETFPFPEPTADAQHDIAEAAGALDSLRSGWLSPGGATEAELRKRTLTNLYNQRPSWLDQAHERLDRAVHAAYGWPYPLDPDEVLERLVELNLSRALAGERVVA